MKSKFIFQFLLILLFSHTIFAQKGENFLTVKTDHNQHQKFGMKYPVTMQLKLLSPTDYVIVTKWNPVENKWVQLTQKSNTDFFNGIEACRFDHTQNLLYVSVCFYDDADSISIKVTDTKKVLVPFEFMGFTTYYDNRLAAITVSADDWKYGSSRSSNTLKAINIFRKHNLWLTLGVIASSGNDADWQELQAEFDSGNVEIASHSHSHPHIPYIYPELEIAGSKIKILLKLTLTGYFANKNQEYLYCWLEPYGESDSIVTPLLAKSNYLIYRSVQKYYDSLSTWNNEIQLYERLGFSVEMGDDKLSHSNIMLLNDRFDYVFSNQGVYHLNIHPEKINWSNDNFAVQHLNYISNRKNAWYVSLGLLYVYQFTILNSRVQMIRF